MNQMPELDNELCSGCGLCKVVCHRGGLVMTEDKVKVIESADCDYCGDCEEVCPTGAISLPYEITKS